MLASSTVPSGPVELKAGELGIRTLQLQTTKRDSGWIRFRDSKNCYCVLINVCHSTTISYCWAELNLNLATGRAQKKKESGSMAGEKPKEPSFLTKAYLLLYNGVLTVG